MYTGFLLGGPLNRHRIRHSKKWFFVNNTISINLGDNFKTAVVVKGRYEWQDRGEYFRWHELEVKD